MNKLLQKFVKSMKGSMDVSSVVVDVALVVALVPIIKTFISDADNLTTSETALLGMVTLFIVLGLIFMVGKQTGLIKSKR